MSRHVNALRRCVAVAMLCATIASGTPTAAMSTSTEIAQGKKENQDIDAASIVVHDPFLTSWVNRVGGQLAQHRIRPDITYTFTVLDDPSINAFAIKGGFVHVNMGLLNFVNSDDELAAILGHEMGHVELHHVTRGQNTSTVIGIIEGIISILSMPAAILSSIGGELLTDKYSRAEELQADHYGVSIASKAGFDPQGAVDVMQHLAKMDPGPGTRADKAFLDHPVPADRISHLLGYAELNRPSAAVTTARAIHDMGEGRFSYARALLLKATKDGPSTTLAAGMHSLDLALRESGGLAAADARIVDRVILPNDPQRVTAMTELKSVGEAQVAALDSAKNESRLGALDLSDLVNHLQTLPVASGQSLDPTPVPAASGAPQKPEAVVQVVNRDVVAIVNLTDDVFATAPGLIAADRQPIQEMSGPLGEGGALTPKYAALFAYYPAMTRDLQAADAQLLKALSDARSTVTDLRTAVQQFNDAVRLAQSQNGGQTPSPQKNRGPSPDMLRLAAAADVALARAMHASDEMYAAQTVNLSAEITLLDLYSSPERYAAFTRAIAYRFPGVHAPSYAQALQLGLSGGDVGCGAWLAFETSKPMTNVLTSMRRTHATCATLAAENNLSAESLEIAEGLLFEDYDDSPSTPS